MPVKNFSPTLLKIFEVGSKKPFEFDCKTEKGAKALRWRLHALRREMRKEKHWLVPVAESVIISVQGTKVVASPPDLLIEEELETALSEHIVEEPKPVERKNVSTLESYLKGK